MEGLGKLANLDEIWKPSLAFGKKTLSPLLLLLDSQERHS